MVVFEVVHDFATRKITALRQDDNLLRIRVLAKNGGRHIAKHAGHYFARKLPIVRWLPQYRLPWLLSDLIAGLSVGMLLVFQAAFYSNIMGVPTEVIMISSWIPSALYCLTGSSNEMFPGPSTTSALLIPGLVKHFSTSENSHGEVFGALSLCVGVWTICFGILDLGLLFNFISLPVILAIGSSLAIVTFVVQIPLLFGLEVTSPMLIGVLDQLGQEIHSASLSTIGLSAICLAILVGLQLMDTSRFKVLRYFATLRSLLVLVIATGISNLINQGMADEVWEMLDSIGAIELIPQVPSLKLFRSLFLPSFLLALALALEHVVLAKALSRTRGYNIDESQELVFLGLANIANSFVGGIPVSGGDIARATVGTTSGVRSPLATLPMAGIIVLCSFVASNLIYWEPLAAVGSVIIVSVLRAMPPLGSVFRYWKISFADFVALTGAFVATLLVGAQIGALVGVGVTLLYTLCRLLFSYPATARPSPDLGTPYIPSTYSNTAQVYHARPGMCIVYLERDVLFLNHERVANHMIDFMLREYSGLLPETQVKGRFWNDYHVIDIHNRRRKANNPRPWLQILVIDFSHVSFIDSSGMQAIQDVKNRLSPYGGAAFEIRLVGMSQSVKTRFRRAGWTLAFPNGEDGLDTQPGTGLVFDNLAYAISCPAQLKANAQVSIFEMDEDNDSIGHRTRLAGIVAPWNQ
ncbi:sulfate transporter family-domain-containing protein [Xylariales sp. PMI_506]|nr:sulfate transporter family-domain-containing protein [Xylariales sp. PMI_506]